MFFTFFFFFTNRSIEINVHAHSMLLLSELESNLWVWRFWHGILFAPFCTRFLVNRKLWNFTNQLNQVRSTTEKKVEGKPNCAAFSSVSKKLETDKKIGYCTQSWWGKVARFEIRILSFWHESFVSTMVWNEWLWVFYHFDLFEKASRLQASYLDDLFSNFCHHDFAFFVHTNERKWSNQNRTR